MIALIDADILCYRAGFVANEPGKENLACYQTGEMIKTMLQETQADSYQCYLSGGVNFRYAIYPNYKGNRKDMAKPIHLSAIREYLCGEWGATVTDGIEADDKLGHDQMTSQDECAIYSLDKDLLMIPGNHYNFVKKEWKTQSNEAAMRHFYWQLIMGDRADNIPGYDGKMRVTVPKFLAPAMEALDVCDGPEWMLDFVLDMYSNDIERLDISARCLWIQRKENDDWTNYLDASLMEEIGRKDDLTALFAARSVQLPDDGLLNMGA